MRRILLGLSFVLVFGVLVSCENDDVIIEEPIQAAAVQDTIE